MLWIRTHRIRIRIPYGSGSSVLKTKIWKKIQLEKIYLFLGLHKGRPSCRKSLQPSKGNIPALKVMNLLNFTYFSGSFLSSWIRIANLDPAQRTPMNPDTGYGSTILVESCFIWHLPCKKDRWGSPYILVFPPSIFHPCRSPSQSFSAFPPACQENSSRSTARTIFKRRKQVML